jgi:hypothetical protein
MNIYEKTLIDSLKRLINLYNLDQFSSTYGFGDREYWGWKTKDFNNATLQGGVHALAIAARQEIFPLKTACSITDAAIKAIDKIRDPNGSVVEAYPRENSFCVTALVAFDMLSAIRILGEDLSEERKSEYFRIIEPLIDFVCKHDEEHAIISNHLATGAAAIALWNDLTGAKLSRTDEFLEVIYAQQSLEGWYREYEGADPGYQTLCTYYLSTVYEITKDPVLLESLRRSAKFLVHFIHPDGTIGGLYGSRNTEVFYPGGIVALAGEIEEFAVIARYLVPREPSQHITPGTIDIGNFIPLLNSYAVAAKEYARNSHAIQNVCIKPFYTQKGEAKFPDAGIYLYANENYFAIINYKKGGTLKVYDLIEERLVTEDGGIFGERKDGMRFTTQQYSETATFEEKEVSSSFYRINEAYPSAFQFVVLRILALSVFRSVFLGNLFKKLIVRKLMTGKKRLDGNCRRIFGFYDKKIVVKETMEAPAGTLRYGHYGKVRAIHMASSGYVLSNQLRPYDGKIEVEFL